MKKFYARLFSVIIATVMAFVPVRSLAAKSADVGGADYKTCKNVIFMIGDGMGFNSINKTKLETGIKTINMDLFPMNGESKTRSADNEVTDSAAGGTALSSAVRTNNSYVGVYSDDKYALESHPMNLAELAVAQGKKSGVITTDLTSGATPASFSAHTSSRTNELDITAQQLSSDLDLIWGEKTASFDETTAKANGFDVFYDKAGMEALSEGSRSFGQFTSSVWQQTPAENMPTMEEMTRKAIDLLDDDEDGFFLMVEGAHIDKNSHSNKGEGMEDALLAFDKAIGVALEYAKTRGDTLVLVTADHETGGLTLNGEGVYEYTTDYHTGVNVPLLVYGSEGFINDGEKIDNKEVSRRVACVMGENNFPLKVEGAVKHTGVVGIEFEEKEYSLRYRSSITLSPNVIAGEGAEYSVTYLSSKTSRATVDENGTVTSVKQSNLDRGSAVILITVTDSYGRSNETACKVNIECAWWQCIVKIALFGWLWY